MAPPRQQWLHERASILRLYPRWLSCILSMVTKNVQGESENENEGISWTEKEKKVLKICSYLRWNWMATLEDAVPM